MTQNGETTAEKPSFEAHFGHNPCSPSAVAPRPEEGPDDSSSRLALGDCAGGTTSGAVCGNGVCEAGNGEDCLSCAADCNGVQSGKPQNRYCCGDGAGTNPVSCSDSRCSAGGGSCTTVPVSPGSFCCGDTTCENGESCATCAVDCGLGFEICDNGIDDDCSGAADCADSACSGEPACLCTPSGGTCSSSGECCSSNCRTRGKNAGTCA